MNLFPVNFVPFLISDGTAKLKGCNTSEDLSTGSCFCTHFQRSFIQFSDYAIELGKHLVFFLLYNLQSFVELFTIGWISLYRKTTWNKEVPGIAVLYLKQFILTTEIVYILN